MSQSKTPGCDIHAPLPPGEGKGVRAAVERPTPEKPDLHIGFVPLSDCAPLVVAKELGFFQAQGLDVRLSRENSWASIRDKVAVGALDGAQMLGPMPLAATLGLEPIRRPLVTAFCFNLNGNAVTLSQSLIQRMWELDPTGMAETPCSARPLRRVIEEEGRRGREPLTLAMVYPFSQHNYLLRYWLAEGGIDPDYDLELVVVPPPQMVDSLRRRRIDGFCVGEPWNSLAVEEGQGRILISGCEILDRTQEKVLGVSEAWAERYPATHLALVRALIEAARWLDEPDHQAEAARILSAPQYVGLPAGLLQPSLSGRPRFALGESPRKLPEFLIFHRHGANRPRRSQGLWLLQQMQRWGQAPAIPEPEALVARVYRGDLYRQALERLGLEAGQEGLSTTERGPGVVAERRTKPSGLDWPQVSPGVAGD